MLTVYQTNARTDDYSASEKDSLRLLERIVMSIREKTPPDFVVGIKFNAGDYVGSFVHTPQAEGAQNHASQDERPLSHLRHIAAWNKVDFIEISGGDYEHPGQSDSSLLRTLYLIS